MSRDAFMIALILAQGGEFGLLILQTMKSGGIEAIPFMHAEILTAIIIVSMMITPILLAVYDKLYKSGKLFKGSHAKKVNKVAPQAPEVLICGFGRVGNTIARMLSAEMISYAAIDMNIDAVMLGRDKGYEVFYGDTTNADILREVGLSPRKTRAVVIALDNAALTKRTVRAVRSIAPRIKIFARARNMPESDILRKEGAAVALPETIEASFMLGSQVLKNIGVSDNKIEKIKSALREGNYANLTGVK
jgi:voltage-gated potassium channel Kch